MKFSELILYNEALPLSEARPYFKIKTNHHRNVFGEEQRVYAPIKATLGDFKLEDLKTDILQDIENDKINVIYQIKDCLSKVIENFNTQAFKTINYAEGMFEEKPGRMVKLAKFLQTKAKVIEEKIPGMNVANLIRIIQTDKQRENYLGIKKLIESPSKDGNVPGYLLCFSRHPYDIVSGSTNRKWTSCMDLKTGSNKRYLDSDIVNGTIAVYFIYAYDKNINNPIARAFIKPLIKAETGQPQKILMALDDDIKTALPSGALTSLFRINIREWVKNNINKNAETGNYQLNKNLYPNNIPSNINHFSIIPPGPYKGTKKEIDFIINGFHFYNKDVVKDVIDYAIYAGKHWTSDEFKTCFIRDLQTKDMDTAIYIQFIWIIAFLNNNHSILKFFESNEIAYFSYYDDDESNFLKFFNSPSDAEELLSLSQEKIDSYFFEHTNRLQFFFRQTNISVDEHKSFIKYVVELLKRKEEEDPEKIDITENLKNSLDDFFTKRFTDFDRESSSNYEWKRKIKEDPFFRNFKLVENNKVSYDNSIIENYFYTIIDNKLNDKEKNKNLEASSRRLHNVAILFAIFYEKKIISNKNKIMSVFEKIFTILSVGGFTDQINDFTYGVVNLFMSAQSNISKSITNALVNDVTDSTIKTIQKAMYVALKKVLTKFSKKEMRVFAKRISNNIMTAFSSSIGNTDLDSSFAFLNCINAVKFSKKILPKQLFEEHISEEFENIINNEYNVGTSFIFMDINKFVDKKNHYDKKNNKLFIEIFNITEEFVKFTEDFFEDEEMPVPPEMENYKSIVNDKVDFHNHINRNVYGYDYKESYYYSVINFITKNFITRRDKYVPFYFIDNNTQYPNDFLNFINTYYNDSLFHDFEESRESETKIEDILSKIYKDYFDLLIKNSYFDQKKQFQFIEEVIGQFEEKTKQRFLNNYFKKSKSHPIYKSLLAKYKHLIPENIELTEITKEKILQVAEEQLNLYTNS